jgi:magnesium transporter
MPDDRGRQIVALMLRPDGAVEELDHSRLGELGSLVVDPDALIWVSATAPGDDDVLRLAAAFGLHELAVEDLLRRGQRPKLDTYEGQSMLVAYEALPGDESATSEIHLFVGRGWLLSVHWSPTPALDAARERFRAFATEQTDTPGELLHTLLDAAVDSYFPVLDAISERIDALEDLVLEGEAEREALREILALKRKLLELRRVLAPMREVANALLRHDLPIVRESALPYYQDLYDHLVRVLDQVDLYRDLLATVLDARQSVVGNSLNAIMKRLTALTVILMVPTLIAGIYGMNFRAMPEINWSAGYPFALALMAASAALAIVFFRRRNWF